LSTKALLFKHTAYLLEAICILKEYIEQGGTLVRDWIAAETANLVPAREPIADGKTALRAVVPRPQALRARVAGRVPVVVAAMSARPG
jgi:hypothetical protein